jgi:signal transduction histidine kinase
MAADRGKQVVHDTSPARLVELVSVETLDSLRGLLARMLAVPVVFTDADGWAVTPVDEPLQFCGSLVRCEAGGTLCLRRAKWDVPEPEIERAIKDERKPGEPVGHRCRGGFRDVAVPILVENETIGYVVFARSLTSPPDVARFRQLAVEGGMPPEAGEAVAEHALVLSEPKVTELAECLRVITGLLARAAHDSVRAARVLELERLRDDMMDMIVHDLRTPLTGVISALQTIEAADYDPELTREFVPSAISSAQTLLGLINTLLDISKMESGEMQIDLSPVRFRDVAEAAMVQVGPLAEDRSHEIALDLDPGCQPVQADQEKLTRTVVNLLANAVKFAPPGGHVRLSSRCDQGGLTFAVSDDGPGIPPEYHQRIFDKFQQVESRKAGQQHSTGLGLTFCKMVAEAHGGRIWVESEAGKGSTFSVFIPARPSRP